MPYTVIKPELCYRCKTFKKLCGLDVCPVRERLRVITKTWSIIAGSSSVSGATPPSGVVGEQGYPKVSVLVNVPPGKVQDEAKFFEYPERWWQDKLTLEDIVRIRSQMVSIMYSQVHVQDYETLLEREISLMQAAVKPVDTEVKIEKIIDRSAIFDLKLFPLSIRVRGEVKVTSNPSIPRVLDKLIYDDVKAREAVIRLYEAGIDIYTIQRAFSFGLLGQRRYRKLVPTRWAITAVDRILSEYLRSKVKKLRVIDKFVVYQVSYLNNRFTVVLVPETLRISWIEFWYSRQGFSDKPVVSVIIDEDLRGDVETMDGGFEAGRMGLLEALLRMGVQARAIIVREILPEYYIGVGNWHIREDMRHLPDVKPVLVTDSPEEVLRTVSEIMHPDVAKLVREKITKILSQTKLI